MKKKGRQITKRFLSVIFIFVTSTLIFSQNVGIGTASPNKAAIFDLDVSSLPANGKKGVLLPRVALLSNTDVTTIPSPPRGLIVYNTANAGTGTNAIKADKLYRFANGTWELLITPSDLIDDENGTVVKKLQFIGTADQNVFLTNGPFMFRLRNASGSSSTLAYDVKLAADPGTAITVYRSTGTGIGTTPTNTNATINFTSANWNTWQQLEDIVIAKGGHLTYLSASGFSEKYFYVLNVQRIDGADGLKSLIVSRY